MGMNRLILLCLVFIGLCTNAYCVGSEISIKFLKTPKQISNLSSAAFSFQLLLGGNRNTCTNCSTYCRLDDHVPSDCEAGEVSYSELQDGNHTFVVCFNGSQGVGCATYNWTIDMVPPTAYVTAGMSLTNAPYVSVNISFSEPCSGGGGFSCASVNACNLHVYGPGQVMPTTLNVIQPNLKYSLTVGLSSSVHFGRVVLVMDKKFCTDAAGNNFARTENSSFFVHFDRRSVFANLRTHVPEQLLQIDSETRTVQATNRHKNLKVYLYFTSPVLNSSAEILNSVHTSQGSLLPISGNTFENRRFGFQFKDIYGMAIVTVSLDSNLILSRQGTPVSPVAPVTFLYDSQRPAVRLSTTSKRRTKQRSIPILIKFMKPVFGFNSSHIFVSGGNLRGFQEKSRRAYIVEIQASGDIISVNIPENITEDVAGNKNLASNILQVGHYSVPVISLVLSSFATAAFAVTALAAGLLTVSTASLQSVGAFSRSSSSFTSNPGRNLFRIACHIQVFALSRWLAVTLPVEYYEFARGLQWSIPYFLLPWETGHIQPVMVGSSSPTNPHSYSSKVLDLGTSQQENSATATSVYGLPLTREEYRSFFESQNIQPEAEYISDSSNSNGWREFNRSMFWLGVIGGSLIVLHALLLFILKCSKGKSEKPKSYGALIFPRFEIFLIILALPCLCQASAALVRGGSSSGVITGILLLGVVSFLLLALFSFLSIGITFGKLLQYKEVHQEGKKFHWYQEIVRVTLGPGKRGQWTWKNQSNSVFLAILGPLFEDLRGPPKYMLSQIAGGTHIRADRIIASEDENEDAEAPFIQKLFGILRIYYTLLEFIRRVSLGIVVVAYSWCSTCKSPIIILLCMTSFQLFFMVLKKPFIKKKVQLVEIISVFSELGIFATCLILLDNEFSTEDQMKIGLFMLSLFLLGYLAQMINEWYALYTQTRQLNPGEDSFLVGLKTASFGLLLLFIPQKMIQKFDIQFPLSTGEIGDTTSSGDRNRSSGSRSSSTGDKPWLKQLRELAKASFSKEERAFQNDPSSSRTRLSGFWNAKRSGSRSLTSSVDSKSRPRELHKDLEAIFASK
ncbi:hypothetical protein LguiB_012876 [Lonicera macranthoides]